LDIGVLGYIGILYHKEHPPEVWHIPPGIPCILHRLQARKSCELLNVLICSKLEAEKDLDFDKGILEIKEF
jgi:hypothetical protein